MINQLISYLNDSKTQYHAVSSSIQILLANGFTQLNEYEKWDITANGKYFVCRDGSALIAFKTNNLQNYSYNIVASHTDSPCMKLKFNSEIKVNNCIKLNVERYGGPILHTFFDRKLCIAGRYFVNENGTIKSRNYTSPNSFVIPSVAIHFNRDVNNGFKINAQTDLSPLFCVEGQLNSVIDMIKTNENCDIIDYDLYLVCNEMPYTFGANNEFLASTRIDNLSSALSSLTALINSAGDNISVAYLADNEEVGSATKQGAGSKFLIDTLTRINISLNKQAIELDLALGNSFMVSCDNAHATHPNHSEYSDPTNKVLLGGGIVIKHHANQNYTTDGFSSSIASSIFDKFNVKYQHFYMRSDLPCGGTLGAISSRQLSIKSIDIGLGQLAMHSAVESMFTHDYLALVNGLTAIFNSRLQCTNFNEVQII